MNNNAPIDQLQADSTYDISADSISLSTILLSVLKRPWILLVSLIVVLTPLSYYLINMSTVYSSNAVVMVSIKGTSFLDAVSMVEGANASAKSEKYYTSILDSKAYKNDVSGQIIDMYPHLDADSLLRAIVIGYTTNRNSPGFIEIYTRSQSKEFALLLAETSIESFRLRSSNLDREDALHVSKFIETQTASVSRKLAVAEEKLQSFLFNNNLSIGGMQAGIAEELFELERKHNETKAQLEMTNINIASYDDQLTELLDKLTNDSKMVENDKILQVKNKLEDINLTLAKPRSISKANIQSLTTERNQLRSQLISLASPVTTNNSNAANLGLTIQKLEQALEKSLLLQTEFSNQVQFYQLQIKSFRKNHPNLSEDILTFANLNRSKEVSQKTLEILLEKREEIRIRAESELGGIKVIDAPRLPDRPLSQNKTQKLMTGILAALGFGIIVTIIIDRFDNTIKDENDIHRSFGLPVFGTIPAVGSEAYHGGEGKRKPTLTEIKQKEDIGKLDNPERSSKLLKYFSEKSPTAEAYRSLKIAIHFLATDNSKKVFVISSPSVSEGKSLTSSNLAISFAHGGNKTLLIDCDLRKSVQHKNFGIDRKPGLSNYFYEEKLDNGSQIMLDDIIKDGEVKNLSIITAGSSPANPAELLASHKMKQLVESLRDQYDFILIDTPPILVCSDSRILAETADGMILVVKVEHTNIKALDHAVNLTKHLNIEISGVILNQVKFKFGRAYYYAYRYYRPYSYYSGYYYKRDYYDYVEDETGGKRKVKKQGKKVSKA